MLGFSKYNSLASIVQPAPVLYIALGMKPLKQPELLFPQVAVPPQTEVVAL